MTLTTTPFGKHATAAEVLDGVDLSGRRFVVTGGSSGPGRPRRSGRWPVPAPR